MIPPSLPVWDETRCTGCGACVAVCPWSCLELRGRTIWMPRPRACVSCAVCVILCPEQALQIGAAEPWASAGSALPSPQGNG
jgi:NAD-dependent dihydropyrimidine dehydrogenase PreA subunit